jgi:hypothetical protein
MIARQGVRGQSAPAMVQPNSGKILNRINICKILAGFGIVIIYLLVLMSDNHVSSLSRDGKSNNRMDLDDTVTEIFNLASQKLPSSTLYKENSWIPLTNGE